MDKKRKPGSMIWTIILGIASVLWIYPVVMILLNSLKKESAISTAAAFKLPTADSFTGIANYIDAIASKGFLSSLGFSTFITITSVTAILICCSMCAWYITRVKGVISQVLYYLFVFSMVVPFQMVMFTLSQTADKLKLNTPWNIWIIYLGFGAGLAVFMFTGFIQGIPLEIEEAAAIDGCGALSTYFRVVFPMLKSILISVGVLEVMWIWNDYLLPYLVLDRTKYMTIPIHVQYLKGSYGTVDLGATMAVIMISIIPVIIVYLFCQKYIIKGVAAGAVKG